MPHTALTYLLDREGKYLDHLVDVLDGDELVGRLRRRVA
jgi:hypothetical protein